MCDLGRCKHGTALNHTTHVFVGRYAPLDQHAPLRHAAILAER
jgi:hypothetical protein